MFVRYCEYINKEILIYNIKLDIIQNEQKHKF